MSTYALSGSGTQALSAGVGSLHVHFTTLDPNNGAGNANPSNLYHAALLRAGDGTGWFTALPVDAVDSWVPLPIGTAELGYAFQNTNAANVTEVFGPSPLAGGVSPLTTKGDLHGFSTVDARLGVGANGDQLVADSTQALGIKWAAPTTAGLVTSSRASLSGDFTLTLATTWYDVLSLTLGAGTYLLLARAVTVDNASASHWDAELYDGSSTIYDTAESSNAGGTRRANMDLFSLRTLGAGNVKLRIACYGNTNTLVKATGFTMAGMPATLTTLEAIKFG